MKIAVPVENDEVYSDFGSAKEFKVYEVDDHKIISATILDTKGIMHGALAVLLNEHKVKLVLLDEISAGSASALRTNGIAYKENNKGKTEEVIKDYLATLS